MNICYPVLTDMTLGNQEQMKLEADALWEYITNTIPFTSSD